MSFRTEDEKRLLLEFLAWLNDCSIQQATDWNNDDAGAVDAFMKQREKVTL